VHHVQKCSGVDRYSGERGDCQEGMITPAEFEQAISQWEEEDWLQQQKYETEKVSMSSQAKGVGKSADGKKKSKKQIKVDGHSLDAVI
jgi:hypothetical protein